MSTSHSLHDGSGKSGPPHMHQAVTTAQLVRNNLHALQITIPGYHVRRVARTLMHPLGWCATNVAL